MENREADISNNFMLHRKRYPARPPDLRMLRNRDELNSIGPADGLFEFMPPPADGVVLGSASNPKTDRAESEKTKYLWVVAQEGVPAALECPKGGTRLSRGRLAHTNLTGGHDAHTGGELWFFDPESIILNGGSGRYGPRSPNELDSVARAFKAAGYKVASMGWDDEAGPSRYLRGEPEWIK